jgi:hypothetical protein
MSVRLRHVVTAVVGYLGSEVVLVTSTHVPIDETLLLSLVPGLASAAWHALVDSKGVV